MNDGFRLTIEASGSGTAMAALDTLHAALWLLAIGDVPQSLVVLHHATESALKGILEEVSPAFTDQKVAKDQAQYECLKHLLHSKIQRHRLGHLFTVVPPANERMCRDVQHSLNNRQEYDPDRTICFAEAFDRVNEALHFQTRKPDVMNKFHKERNRIVHSGGTRGTEKDHLCAILAVALPFVAELYQKAYSVDLRDFIPRTIARELLDVAPRYLNEEPEANSLQVLYTFRQAWHWTYRYELGQTVYLSEHDQRDFWWDDHQEHRAVEIRRRFLEENSDGDDYPLGTDWSPPISCRICGGPCFVITEPVLHSAETGQFLVAKAVQCPGCGLHADAHRFPSSKLASLHVGAITRRVLGAAGWAQVLRDLAD